MITKIQRHVEIKNIEGSGYYKSCVEVDHLHWNFLWEEMTDWCLDNLGLDSHIGRWHMSGNKFFFEREDDMMLFIVRWS